MNGIFELLKSPSFWFGSVIIGILINIASHFLIQKWGGWLSKISKKWATRTEKLSKERENRILALMNNPSEQIFQLSEATYIRSRGNQHMMFTSIILLYLIGFGLVKLISHVQFDWLLETFKTLVAIFSLFLMISASIDFFDATSKVSEIREARSREKKLKEINENTRHQLR